MIRVFNPEIAIPWMVCGTSIVCYAVCALFLPVPSVKAGAVLVILDRIFVLTFYALFVGSDGSNAI